MFVFVALCVAAADVAVFIARTAESLKVCRLFYLFPSCVATAIEMNKYVDV